MTEFGISRMRCDCLFFASAVVYEGHSISSALHIDNDELDECNLARFKLNSILTGINNFIQFEKIP